MTVQFESSTIDLHNHTTYSDGALSVSELIDLACREGVSVFGIADHDTIGGVAEFKAECQKCNLPAISGVEISATFEGKDFHLLGFGFDAHNPRLCAALDDFAASRVQRVQNWLNTLSGLGISVSVDELKATKGSIGKPHLAQFLLNTPSAMSILKEYGMIDEPTIYQKGFAKGGVLHEKRPKYNALQAIQDIHQAGGVALFAHPGWSFRKHPEQAQACIDALFEAGLDGLEVFYPTHSQEQTVFYYHLAEKHQALMSAGSDFHAFEKEGCHKLLHWQSYGLQPKMNWLKLFI